jgi:hypothetical protein
LQVPSDSASSIDHHQQHTNCGIGNTLYFQYTLTPDLRGANADADGDGIPNAIEQLEGTNQLVKDNDIFTAIEPSRPALVLQLCRDLLNDILTG